MIYLDNAATTLQKPYTVVEAAQKAIRRMTTPGRGGHSASMLAAETAYSCRERAARLFGAGSPESIIFTFNATHALNIAIKSLARENTRVLVTGYEHNSVVRPLNAVGAKVTVAGTELFEPEDAVRAFEQRLSRAELVVMNHTSNVFGYVLPIRKIASMCKAAKIPFIIDASQSAGVLDIDFEELGADFIAMPGHKGLYGPQGTGILIARGGKTLIEGGTGGNSQLPGMPDFVPDRFEAGTHNMPGIAGLEAGIKFVEKIGTKMIMEHERELIREASGGLKQIDGIRIYRAKNEENQTGVISFNLRDLPSEQVANELSERKVAVRAGLHCAPLAHRSAGTITQGTVRISVSVFNTKHEIHRMLNYVEEISKKFN